jgi:hypothetical protein
VNAETAVDLFAGLFGELPGRRRLSGIWATVDRDRVVGDLGLPAETLPDDPHLGAFVVLVRPAGDDPVAIVEPATEGRLAAVLARHGEGPIGVYIESPVDLDSIASLVARRGLAASAAAVGPFGPSVLVTAGPAAKDHLVLVQRPAGTIGR